MRKIAAFAGSFRNSFAFCQLPLRKGPADSRGDTGGRRGPWPGGAAPRGQGTLRSTHHLGLALLPPLRPPPPSPVPHKALQSGCSLPAPPCSPGSQAPQGKAPCPPRPRGGLGDRQSPQAGPSLSASSEVRRQTPAHAVPAQGSLRFPHTAGGPCHCPAGQTLWGSLTPGMPPPPVAGLFRKVQRPCCVCGRGPGGGRRIPGDSVR